MPPSQAHRCSAPLFRTMPMRSTDSMAQAFAAQPRAASTGFPPVPMPESPAQDPVYLAALQACSARGFIAPDAQCLARAWQARTQRTGSFQAEPWPDAPRDFGLQPEPRAHRFAPCPERLGLYAVL